MKQWWYSERCEGIAIDKTNAERRQILIVGYNSHSMWHKLYTDHLWWRLFENVWLLIHSHAIWLWYYFVCHAGDYFQKIFSQSPRHQPNDVISIQLSIDHVAVSVRKIRCPHQWIWNVYLYSTDGVVPVNYSCCELRQTNNVASKVPLEHRSQFVMLRLSVFIIPICQA